MQSSDWNRRRWLGALAAAGAVACRAGSALAAAADAAARPAADPEIVLRALVRAIIPFDDPKFPDIGLPQIEQRMLIVANLLADPGYRAGLTAFDAAGSSSAESSGSFAQLPLAAARRVVAEWFESPSTPRRAFVSTTKAVALIALYSLPAAWPAIHYAGPFDAEFDRDFR